jgi:hypothetical protein
MSGVAEQTKQQGQQYSTKQHVTMAGICLVFIYYNVSSTVSCSVTVLVLWCLVFIPLGKTQEQGSSNKLHPWQ